MQVIPVIDLKDSQAVHAIAGDRATYKPIQLSGSNPGDALALTALYAARNPVAIYLADLDAIEGKPAQTAIWLEISKLANCPLWIDCGVRDAASLSAFLAFQRFSHCSNCLITGSETLESLSQLKSIAFLLKPKQIIVSLDRRNGLPLSRNAILNEEALLEKASSLGIARVIALDLAGVGTGRASELLARWQNIKAKFPELSWTLGGGIATQIDLDLAAQAGFRSVLSATAILSGTL
jgi:HisA/HisF family protein